MKPGNSGRRSSGKATSEGICGASSSQPTVANEEAELDGVTSTSIMFSASLDSLPSPSAHQSCRRGSLSFPLSRNLTSSQAYHHPSSPSPPSPDHKTTVSPRQPLLGTPGLVTCCQWRCARSSTAPESRAAAWASRPPRLITSPSQKVVLRCTAGPERARKRAVYDHARMFGGCLFGVIGRSRV